MAILRRLFGNVFPLFYEETRVARYVVLSRSVGGIKIPGEGPEIIGSEWAPHFALPGLLIQSPAVLLFTAKPENANARISVRLQGFGDHLLKHTFADGNPHSWHLLIRPLRLEPEDNELIFAVSEGSVTFSDAVILYTSNQLTVKKPSDLATQPTL